MITFGDLALSRPLSRPWPETLLEQLGAPVWAPGKWGTLILRADCPESIWHELSVSRLRMQDRYDVMMVPHDLTRVAFGSGITIDLHAAQYMGEEFMVGWYPNTDMAQIPVARGQHLDMIATLHDVSRGMDEDDNSLRRRIAAILETPPAERWSEQRRYGMTVSEIVDSVREFGWRAPVGDAPVRRERFGGGDRAEAEAARDAYAAANPQWLMESEYEGPHLSIMLSFDRQYVMQSRQLGVWVDIEEGTLRSLLGGEQTAEAVDANESGETLLCVFCDKPARIRAEGFAPECDECASQWED